MKTRYKAIITFAFLGLLIIVSILWGFLRNYTESKSESPNPSTIENRDDSAITEISHNVNEPQSNEYCLTDGNHTTYYEIQDGILYGYGNNTHGQFGTGEVEAFGIGHTTPVKIADHVKHVSADNHGYVIYLTEDGDLYGIGYNYAGQLGQPVTEAQRKSGDCNISVPVLIDKQVQYGVTGNYYVIYLKEDGKLYTLGNNIDGIIGNGTPYDSNSTEKQYFSEPQYIMDDVVYIACGPFNAAAITSYGDLYLWGDNSCAQMGNGSTGNGNPIASDSIVTTPYLAKYKIQSVQIDHQCITVLTYDGERYQWGDSYAPKKNE